MLHVLDAFAANEMPSATGGILSNTNLRGFPCGECKLSTLLQDYRSIFQDEDQNMHIDKQVSFFTTKNETNCSFFTVNYFD